MLSETMRNENSKAIDIMRKYFFNTELLKEYKIASALSKDRSVSEQKASLLIQTALEAHKKLNKDKLRKEKYALISEIKGQFDIDEFFKAKIENYKQLASIGCLLESHDLPDVNVDELSKFKFSILENIVKGKKVITESDEVNEFFTMDKGTRHLVYKILIEKFNTKYKGLDDNQSEIVREYINNISITPKLKDYIDGKLIEVLTEIKDLYKKLPDQIVKIKLKEIVDISRGIIDAKSINEDDISYVLNAFELVKELKKIDENKKD